MLTRVANFLYDVEWWLRVQVARRSGNYCERHQDIFVNGACYWCADIMSTRFLPQDTEPFQFSNGKARVHAASVCEDRDDACPIHRHSDHPGGDLPMLLRETGLIEHTCSHGVGHPCPDSAAFYDRLYGHPPGTWSVHGCDGCTHG